MRLERSIRVCLGLAIVGTPVVCQGQQKTRRVTSSSTLSGSCDLLEAQNKVVTPCDGRLAEFDWTDGEVSFVFTTTDGVTTLAFMGDGAKRTLREGGMSVQPVGAMFNSVGTKTSTEVATGACDISAAHGTVVTVSCEATTPSGRFRGRFTSDGQPASTKIAGQ